MNFLKIKKGTYGYIDAKKKKQLLWTIVLFLIVFVIFITGILINKTRLNVLTVVAVCGVMPAARALLSYIMLFKYHTFEKEIYDKIKEHEGTLTMGYEYVITTEKEVLSVTSAAICGKTLCVYTMQKEFDEKKCTEYLKGMMKNNDMEGISIKIFKEFHAYLRRMDEMNENLADHERNLENEQKLLMLLGALSY